MSKYSWTTAKKGRSSSEARRGALSPRASWRRPTLTVCPETVHAFNKNLSTPKHCGQILLNAIKYMQQIRPRKHTQ